MNLAGYVVHTPSGDIGSRGTGYTYVLAGNGLFLEAYNTLLEARIALSSIMVRGLPHLEPQLRLQHGPVPSHLPALVLNAMSGSPDREMYAALVWDGDYRLVFPLQEGGGGHVNYEVAAGTVVSIHSHGTMGAFFSGIDDWDDQGFLVSVVVGHLDRLVPAARARLCVYGYFAPVGLEEIFAGALPVVEGDDVYLSR